jgi:hypothetical protein
VGIPQQINRQELADLQKSEAVRILIEAAAQATPVTAALATILRFTHPSDLQKALDKQRSDMIATAVDHEARLSAIEAFVRPRLRISIRALALGRAVSELSTGTFREALPCADLQALTKLTQSEWEESLVEFKHEKLANLEQKLLRPTWRAFATFDPIFRGTDPISDGAAIASIVADATEEPLVQAVAEKTKLPQRQFNPAMQFLTETTNGGVRRTINGEWCFLPSHVGRWSAEDRYKFRRVSENATDLAMGLLST